jgi:bacterioferritin
LEKERTVELLNLDLQDEHGAIIQYLGHAYAMGEGEVACEIEAIARDEMRHLDWLAETIVELGGKPSLTRGKMNAAWKTVPDWMGDDVGLEQGAIDQYRAHIGKIDDAVIKRLLERIVADETAHQAKFVHFVDKARRESLTDIRGNRDDKVAGRLNWGVQHEYTVVLQYLFHSYLTANPEAKKQLEDQAINEMQHMGWLAEELAGAGGTPRLEHTRVELPAKTSDMLKVNIAIEKDVIKVYDEAAWETGDASLRQLLLRIRDNEKYHVGVFTDVLNKVQDKL